VQIDTAKFRTAFTQRAQRVLSQVEKTTETAAPTPSDQVSLSGGGDPSVQGLKFEAAVTAIATSATLGGIPGLAALTQDVAHSLVSEQQEIDASARMVDQFTSLPLVQDERVESVWSGVAEVTESPHDAPLVYESFFIDAQADARNMMLGTETLKGDLADDNVLAFTVAHEEGHRQHRDTAGTAGLQALMDLTENDKELYSLAYQAMAEGRQQNEREADLFAAEAMTELGYDKQPMLEFLNSLPGDIHHPVGTQRAQAVDEIFQEASDPR
jgi:hypothetical protein